MFDSIRGQGSAPKARFGTGALISVVLHLALIGVAWGMPATPATRSGPEVAVVLTSLLPSASSGSSSLQVPAGARSVAAALPTPRTRLRRTFKKQETVAAVQEVAHEAIADTAPSPLQPEAPLPSGTATGDNPSIGAQTGPTGGGSTGPFGLGAGGAQPSVLPFGEGMTRPIQIDGRDPSYTREALAAHTEGVIIAKCVITMEGHLERCRVVKSLPHMESAVLDALATRRYRPVTFQGQPVSVDYVFTIKLVMPR